MPKCTRCGRKGLFLWVSDGLCLECNEAIRIADLQKQEEDLNKNTPDVIPTAPPVSFNFADVPDRGTLRQPIFNGCPQLYGYVGVSVSSVDCRTLQNIVISKSYDLIAELCPDGSVALNHDGEYVCKLAERVDMCADWLRRGDPIRCEMTGFKPGREHVVLCFYRDEEKRLSYRESVIVKLTSYTSEYKQDNIQNLKPGEKLTCSEDDYNDDKVNVLDWCSEPIGRLSKKYADRFFDEGFAGVFFDHADEDAEGRLVPYVKIYF